MTPTTLFLTGFEQGVTSVSGAGLVNSITGTAAVSTLAARNGSYGLRVNPAANTAGCYTYTLAALNHLVGRFAFRVNTLPATGTRNIMQVICTGVNANLAVTSAGVVTLAMGGGGTTVTYAPTLDANWHVFEWQLQTAANPWTCDWKIDGISQTQVTSPTAVNTITGLRVGDAATTQPAWSCDYDDTIYGTWATALPDWYGDGLAIAQLAGSDGTHSTVTAFSPGDAGTAYSGTVTTAWTQVALAAPWAPLARNTTVNLAQRTVNTAAYMEIAPAAIASGGSANAVRAVLAYSSSGVTANSCGCIALNSAGTPVVVFGDLPVGQGGGGGALADYSESTNFFKGAIVTTPAAGWTAAEVNSVRWRLGGAGVVVPIPTVQGLMLEVDWPVYPRPRYSRRSTSPMAVQTGGTF